MIANKNEFISILRQAFLECATYLPPGNTINEFAIPFNERDINFNAIERPEANETIIVVTFANSISTFIHPSVRYNYLLDMTRYYSRSEHSNQILSEMIRDICYQFQERLKYNRELQCFFVDNIDTDNEFLNITNHERELIRRAHEMFRGIHFSNLAFPTSIRLEKMILYKRALDTMTIPRRPYFGDWLLRASELIVNEGPIFYTGEKPKTKEEKKQLLKHLEEGEKIEVYRNECFQVIKHTGKYLMEAGNLFKNCLRGHVGLDLYQEVYCFYKKRPSQTKYRKYAIVDFNKQEYKGVANMIIPLEDRKELYEIYLKTQEDK